MTIRSARALAVAASVAAAAALGAPRVAHAQDPAAEIEAADQLAIENIDLGDLEAAKAKLVEALAHIEAAGLGDKPAAARTHMLLGLVYTQGFADAARGEKHMVRAVELDVEVKLDGHADATSKALWAKAQQKVNPTIDCATLEGIVHRRVGAGEAGKPIEIRAKLGALVLDGPREVRYRAGAMAEFAALPLEKVGDCEVGATIPAAAVVAPSLRYYVAIRTAGGKLAAASGTEARPNVVEVAPEPTAAAAASAVEVRRQVEEVPQELQTGKGKGGSCAGCAGGGEGGALATIAATLAIALPRRRRRRT